MIGYGFDCCLGLYVDCCMGIYVDRIIRCWDDYKWSDRYGGGCVCVGLYDCRKEVLWRLKQRFFEVNGKEQRGDVLNNEIVFYEYIFGVGFFDLLIYFKDVDVGIFRKFVSVIVILL